jgi:hypothetical protein
MPVLMHPNLPVKLLLVVRLVESSREIVTRMKMKIAGMVMITPTEALHNLESSKNQKKKRRKMIRKAEKAKTTETILLMRRILHSR